MCAEARFTCRFAPHALGLSERIGDLARSRGLISWTTQIGGEYEIRFEGPTEALREFAAEIGVTAPELAIVEEHVVA